MDGEFAVAGDFVEIADMSLGRIEGAAGAVAVDGVEAGRPRVLVGNDARLIDAIVRLLPGRYPRVAVALERRLRR